MLKIEKLELTNWCQHKALETDFSATTTGVVGRNGAGKSNTISALHFALTGKPLGSATNEDCINWDSDTAEIKLRYSVHGTPGVITRKLSAARMDPEDISANAARAKCKTSATLTFGDEDKVTGVKPVQERISALLGVDRGVLSQHVFISQDSLNDLLFSSPADRVKAMVMLMPEIGKAEKIRAELSKEMARVPEQIMATSLSEMEARTVEARETHAEAERKAADLSAKLEAVREKGELAPQAIYTHHESVKHNEELQQVLGEITRLNSSSAEQDLLEKAADVERLSALAKEQADTAAGATKALNAHDALAWQVSRRDELTKQRAPLQQKVEECARATEAAKTESDAAKEAAKDVPALESEIAKGRDELAMSNAWLTAYTNGDGKCPTCHQPMAECPERVETERAKVQQLSSAIGTLETAVSELQSRVRTAELGLNTASQKLEIAGRDLAQNTFSLEELTATGELMQEEDVKAAREAVAAYEDTRARLASATAAADSLKADASARTSTLASLRAKADTLEELATGILEADKLAEHMRVKKEYDDLKSSNATAQAELKASNHALAVASAAFEDAKQVVADLEKRNEYRAFLEQAREILHRDNLPTRLLAQKALAMRDGCNRFLQLFGSPFALDVSGDMTMTCTMPSGHVVPIYLLSGGQRSVLSVCMRFAINELFGNKLGLLVLDEPSASMDSDNVIAMRRLFEQIHTVSLSTGVQTLAITHHPEMLGAFESVVEV